MSLYCCTKASVTTLTKAMAVELAPHGIKVNAVCPSRMDTEIVPMKTELDKQLAQDATKQCLEKQITKRLLTVEETADVIMYLSTDFGSMVNGTSFLVDGGASTA